MAIGKASDFTIRDALFDSVFEERIIQNLNVFNEASKNSIVIMTQAMAGDYGKRRFFDRLLTTNNRRDTTSVSAQTDTALTQDEIISVKRSRKFKTHAQTLDAWEKANISSTQMNVMLAQNFADETGRDYLEAAYIALVSALSVTAGSVYDYSGTGDADYTALIRALALFGDQQGQIVCWHGHSNSLKGLQIESLSVSSGQVGASMIYDAQIGTVGRPLVVSDSDNLKTVATPVDYFILGLVENACVISVSEERRFVADLVTGLENLVLRYQGEYAYNVEIKGHKWDFANGGANPDDTALKLNTNWDIAVADPTKNGPGVRLEVDATA